MRALFICAHTRGIAHYAERAVAINSEYCKRWGYGLECETDDDKIIDGCEQRSSFWYYFKQLATNFGRPDVDWFVKLDCDAVCVNHQWDLEHWISGGDDIIWATDIGPDVMNAGVQLIRNTPVNQAFYQRVWEAAERVGRGQFKTGLWHEQTMLGAAFLLRGPAGPQIRVVSNATHKSFNCFHEDRMSDCIIFHDISKKRIPRFALRGDKVVMLASPVKEPVVSKPIAVVYYAYLVHNWEEMVAEQLRRLKSSGLYDAAKEIWIISCGGAAAGKLLSNMVAPDSKVHFQHTDHNLFEYWGLAKAKELAETGDWKILYWHTKGIANIYADMATKEVSERKVIGKKGWRNYLEYFCVDKWRDCVEALDTHDMAVAFYHHGNRWPWGNFWWATSDYLRTREAPVAGADRWYFEAWAVTAEPIPKIHEGKHLEFDFHTSDWPAFLYDGSLTGEHRLVLHKATYGSVDVQIDEGRPSSAKVLKVSDVTELLRQKLAEFGGRRLDTGVGNDSMGGDPDFGQPKMLKLWWSLDTQPDKTYYTAAMEGQHLLLEV